MRLFLLLTSLILLPFASHSATISGTVTDAGSGLPIEGASVAITDVNAYFGTPMDLVVTDASGSYSLTFTVDPGAFPTQRLGPTTPAVVAGDVLLEVVAPVNAPMRAGDVLGVVNCFFFCELNDQSLPELVGAISIADGDSRAENFALEAGATLSGTVTASGGGPLAQVPIVVFTANPAERYNAASFGTVTDVSGNYTSVTAVKPGNYFLGAGSDSFISEPLPYGNFVAQAFGGFTCEFLSCVIGATTPVSVMGSTNVGGLDFVLEPGGELSGQLIYADTGLPLSTPDSAQIRVWTPDDGRNLAQFTVRTDAFGAEFDASFSIQGLVGSYIIEIDPGPSLETNLIRILNDGQSCPFAGCDRADGVPITLVAGSPVVRDFALQRGGKITGTLTDAASGMGVDGGFSTGITVLNAAGEVVGGGFIQDGGLITTADGIVPGNYFVATGERFGAIGISSQDNFTFADSAYVDQAYLGVNCQGLVCDLSAATPVTVTAGSVTTGIDFSLTTGFYLSGTVTAAGSGEPLAGRNVEIYATTGRRVQLSRTDDSGNYRSNGLPPGDYRIVVKDGGKVSLGNSGFSGLGYFGQVFGNPANCVQDLCSPASGSNVSISAADVNGIDFQLNPGPTISGQVIDTLVGLPVLLTVDVFTDTDTLVGSWSTRGSDDASYTTGALLPGTYNLIPRITRTFSIGSPATVVKGAAVPGTLTINITDADVVDARLGVFQSLVFGSGFESN